MGARRSIKTNIAFITILAILVTSAAVFLVTYIQLSALVDISVQDHITDVMDTFQIEVNYQLERAESAAKGLANYGALVGAMQSGNAEIIQAAAEEYYESAAVETNNVAVTDARGNVLYCLEHGTAVQSLASQVCVASAMKGQAKTEISEHPKIRLGAVSAAPVKDSGGAVIGTVMVIYPFDDNELVDEVKGQADSEYTIFMGDERLSTTLIDGGKRMVGTKMNEKIAKIVLTDKQEYKGEATIAGKEYTSLYKPMLDSSGNTIGALFCGVLTSNIKKEESQAVFESIIVAIIAATVSAVCVIIYVNRSVVAPIIRLSEETGQISHGNLKVEINKEGNNEIGDLAGSLKITVDTVKGYINDISANLNLMADGDMNVKITKDYIGDFAPIRASLEKISDSLNNTLSSINLAAFQVTSASGQVAQGSQSLSAGAAQQASSIEELAATIHEVADKVNDNAKSAEQAMSSTNETGEKLRAATEKMDELVIAMNETKDCSDKIGKIIKTIEDIAFQTNILALNAAVEAARAGTAGKGFAVVADEVRNLAAKSAEAANNTNVLIENTIASVDKGNGLVSEVAEMMSAVSEASGQVSQLNTNICRSSADVVDSISQINTGIDQISGVVQTNSATAEESAAASEELSGQANMLQEQIAQFRLRS